MKGFYDRDSGTIYLNMAKMDGSKAGLMETLGNELSHVVDHKQGRGFDKTRQTISTDYGDDAGRQQKGMWGRVPKHLTRWEMTPKYLMMSQQMTRWET